jgi:hypothetical protein
MIEVNTIYFRKTDVPDLPELKPKCKARKKRETPEPKDWRPFGTEW